MPTSDTTITANWNLSGGWSSDDDESIPDPGTPVTVDGKTVNIGTESVSGSMTTVTINQLKLDENIRVAALGSSVVVSVGENSSAAASLMVKNIADMAA